MERKIDFTEVLSKLLKNLEGFNSEEFFSEETLRALDMSDLGNEVGIALGNSIPKMSQEELNVFIMGLKHGVSLTNGTH